MGADDDIWLALLFYKLAQTPEERKARQTPLLAATALDSLAWLHECVAREARTVGRRLAAILEEIAQSHEAEALKARELAGACKKIDALYEDHERHEMREMLKTLKPWHGEHNPSDVFEAVEARVALQRYKRDKLRDRCSS